MAKTKNTGKDVESQTKEQVTPEGVIGGEENNTLEEKTVSVEEPLLKSEGVGADGTSSETASEGNTLKEKAGDTPSEHVETIGTTVDNDKSSTDSNVTESNTVVVGADYGDGTEWIEESEAEFLLAPYEQKKTIKKLKGFLLGISIVGFALATVVGVLYMQLGEREGIIKDTQNNLLAAEEALSEEQKDAEKVSKLVIEQQEKITQYEADIEQYKLVLEERNKEIEKLKAIQAETNTKVVGLEKQLKELTETFEAFKSDILGIVED